MGCKIKNSMGKLNLAAVFQLLSLLGSASLGMIKLGSCSEDQAHVKCIHNEREALLIFKKGLTDHMGRLSSWVGEDCCRWRGVECNNKSSHVTKLDLRNPYIDGSYGTYFNHSGLGGQISSSLIHLKFLSYLDLSLNNFQGIQIPEVFGMLENLMYLDLSFSSFSGEIPPYLGNLSSLMHLDLRVNYNTNMYAKNLDWVSSLSSLEYLNMGGVNLSSVGADWLLQVNMVPSLLELHLQRCNLESLPPSLPFVNLSSLFVLDLSDNQFNSSILHWLFNLTSLTKLDLSSIKFQGSIPYDFVNLRNLEVLYLQGSGYTYNTSQLPRFFGNLCKLKTLDLSWSDFSHGFFTAFSACPNNSLETLYLGQNELVEKIPNSLGRLGSLKYLDLKSNSFWGSIPASIGNLSSLQTLDLSYNDMNLTIPESFGKLSALVNLYLISSSWEGVITEAQLMNLTRLEDFGLTTRSSRVFNVTYNWVPPFKLKRLELENCVIGPKFPVWLKVQSELIHVKLVNAGIFDTISEEWFSKISSKLRSLDLSNNQIFGNLPHQFLFINLGSINLSYNRFKGPFPFCLSNGTQHQIGFLSLKSNFFSGPIPPNISDIMPKLYSLDLSKNFFNGTIPSIQKMNHLIVLNLRNNQLSGELPHHYNESHELEVVDIAYNNLSGKIPSSMGFLRSLFVLMLSNNNLYGEIPSSLQNCSFLSINLGGNHLSGNLPSWIGSQALMLRLRSNLFNGIIPQQWCNHSFLHILDLAQNNLSGGIPNCLGNLNAFVYGRSNGPYHIFYYIEEAVLVTKGRELQYGMILKFVYTIDLSGNNLTGRIPDEITSLIQLNTLNLSMNHLTGSIPLNIGNLRQLETLDLSNNSLSGPIPASMGSLTFLTHFNLSINNLVGRIPFGYQLQTLNDASIYKGNPSLCGSPLPTRCPGHETSNSPTITGGSVEDKQDGDYSERLWFYVSLGLGFVVGFWSVCGTLLVKKSWRHSYFRFCDDVKDRMTLIIALKLVHLKRKFGLEKN